MTKIQEIVTTKTGKDVRKQWECKLVSSVWKPKPRSLQKRNYHRVPAMLPFNIYPKTPYPTAESRTLRVYGLCINNNKKMEPV